MPAFLLWLTFFLLLFEQLAAFVGQPPLVALRRIFPLAFACFSIIALFRVPTVPHRAYPLSCCLLA